jgi:hypothetical protein
VQVVLDRDERRRAATDGIEQRHQLGHRGHLHATGGVQAEAPADGDADEDDRPADDADAVRLGPEQLAGEDEGGRRGDGQGHPVGRQEVAVARGRRRIHAGQAEDERDGARQPGDPNEDFDDAEGVHRSA